MATATKYRVDEKKRKRFPAPLFTVKQVVIVNDAEVEKYRKRHKRLPLGIYPVQSKEVAK